jgi:hypothetical protein
MFWCSLNSRPKLASSLARPKRSGPVTGEPVTLRGVKGNCLVGIDFVGNNSIANDFIVNSKPKIGEKY